MKTEILWQRIEGAAIFLAGFWIYYSLGGAMPWWMLLPAFFAPDIMLLAYAGGRRIGAFFYNLVHFYGFGLIVLMLGSTVADSWLMMVLGALWLAHSGFDRMLGIGLKTSQGFRFTHLGQIGRNR